MLKRSLIMALLLISFVGLSGQSEQLVINPPAGSEERFFTFENPKGSIRVTGYEGNMIVVTGTLRFPANTQNNAPGLRRIEQNPVDIKAEVNGRSVLLLCGTAGKTVDFDIKIPARFSLKLRSADNGNIEVLNVNGEIDIVNNNGSITLENITGSAVLSSVYGDIAATFREVRTGSPLMFTSFEGDVVLTIPSSTNANLKMKTANGEILTDFNIQPLKRQPVVKQTENTSLYSLEDWITGSINNGGPEFVLQSYTGNITLKKR